MAQPFDAVEREMGISSYMSTENSGFAAVLKARFSDFVVHEGESDYLVVLRFLQWGYLRYSCFFFLVVIMPSVSQSGKVARLESLVPDESMKIKPAEDSRKRKHPDNEEPATPLSPEEQWNSAQAGLTAVVGEDSSTKAITLLKYWEDESNAQDSTEYEKYFVLPAVADKDARRALHELIRSQLAFCALADTHEGRVRIWHKRFEKTMPNYGKFVRNNNNNNSRRQKTKWPADRPDYLQFVMYKENMDTSFACKEVVRRVNQRKVRIGYAGMKDKRGVTTQFCTLYRQEPQVLTGINKGGRGGGNTNKGQVGILRVGNFEYVSKELSLGCLEGNRFDVVLRNVDVSTDEKDRIPETKKCLEAAALALRQRGFINYFGMQRFGKYYDTHKVGLCILKGDFEGAVQVIMQPKADEMPRIAMARERWAKRFDNLGETADMDAREKAERDCARDVLRDLGRFMTCEVAILNSLVRKPCDYRRAFGCITRTMRMMFLHAVQSLVWNHVASSRIDTLGRDVVVGDLVLTDNANSTHDVGSAISKSLEGKTVKVVDAADVASKNYDMTDVVLPMVGTKIQYPENESGALFDTLLADHGITKKHFSKVQDRDLSFKGDYRKLVCKSTDVDFEILEYTDPLQPLVKTDLMKLDGVELDLPSAAENGEKKDVLLGMVVGFTLPSSSYATIALRELMKRPTSSEYQRQLKLEGKCEGEFSSAAEKTQDSS